MIGYLLALAVVAVPGVLLAAWVIREAPPAGVDSMRRWEQRTRALDNARKGKS